MSCLLIDQQEFLQHIKLLLVFLLLLDAAIVAVASWNWARDDEGDRRRIIGQSNRTAETKKRSFADAFARTRDARADATRLTNEWRTILGSQPLPADCAPLGTFHLLPPQPDDDDANDGARLVGHLYCRYFADRFGGQARAAPTRLARDTRKAARQNR